METIKAKDVMCGDVIDLEDDKYADPQGDNALYECELLRVMNYEHETDECIRIDFANDNGAEASVGFPMDHELKAERLI